MNLSEPLPDLEPDRGRERAALLAVLILPATCLLLQLVTLVAVLVLLSH